MKISLHMSSVYIENRIDNGISSVNIVTSSVGTVDSEIPSSHNSDWIQDSWATSSYSRGPGDKLMDKEKSKSTRAQYTFEDAWR